MSAKCFDKYITTTRRNGKVAYRFLMGAIECVAYTKSNVIEMAMAEMEKHANPPEVGLVRNGEDVRIVIGWGDRAESYKPHQANAGDGIVQLTMSSHGTGDVKHECEIWANHFAQQEWAVGSQIPEWLPESMRRDFESWIRFQVAYKIAKESGCDSSQCHRLGCEAMSEPVGGAA